MSLFSINFYWTIQNFNYMNKKLVGKVKDLKTLFSTKI